MGRRGHTQTQTTKKRPPTHAKAGTDAWPSRSTVCYCRRCGPLVHLSSENMGDLFFLPRQIILRIKPRGSVYTLLWVSNNMSQMTACCRSNQQSNSANSNQCLASEMCLLYPIPNLLKCRASAPCYLKIFSNER